MTRQVPAELFIRGPAQSVDLLLNPESGLRSVEPLFQLAENKALYLNVAQWKGKAADYLARRVARVPMDLRAHVQRVNVNLMHANEEGTYAAVLDLFIALGRDGKLLRRRVLHQARGTLRPLHYQALHDALDQGVSALTAMPLARRSVLSKGVIGVTTLVENLLVRVMRQGG